jgi:uncharacterized protein
MVSTSPKTALITGASSGIGAVFARQLAAQGHHLILVARRKERLDTLAGELQQHYPISVEALAADLADPNDLQRLEQVIARLDGLVLLVNNAGFGVEGKFTDPNTQGWEQMLRVHVDAVVRLSRAAALAMLPRRTGAVINVASVAGLLPVTSVMYGSTKAFQIAFSEGLQAELHGTGIRVQALCPGFTHTEFHDRLETFDKKRFPSFVWGKADAVVAESLRALQRPGGVVCVPGYINRLGIWLAHLPFAMPIVRRLGRREMVRRSVERSSTEHPPTQ